MDIYKFPEKAKWKAIIERPVQEQKNLETTVKKVFDAIKKDGDKALKAFTNEFDGVDLVEISVTQSEISESQNQISDSLKKAIQNAYSNIYKFHEAQLPKDEFIETQKGVECWRKSTPISKVGLYIPGGTAPLFSTVLMLGVPAKIAKCEEIVLCTPPNKEGNIHPAILYTANLIGIKKIYKLGGIQAIGAMAMGTDSVPGVYKIFGPGNQFVTAAKQVASLNGIAIDMPAGPSEVLVYADESGDPEFIASDLLSQAEHGKDSQAIFVSTSPQLIEAVDTAVKTQLNDLPRKTIAEEALKHSKSILVNNEDEALELINYYAPEHLILVSKNEEKMVNGITDAGSVFIGNFTPESAGDYASGTNHTLPTNGYAKSYSGVSLDSFYKKITFQKITQQGIQKIGPTIEIMANEEQLFAHKNAVTLRLKKK